MQAREALTRAGDEIEDRQGLPDCSSNHEPPHTSCTLTTFLTDGLWRLDVVVLDRRGGALIKDAPWFAGSGDNQMVVRFTVSY